MQGITYHLKVIANVKSFWRQTEKQRDMVENLMPQWIKIVQKYGMHIFAC